jgi:hypothetical protein
LVPADAVSHRGAIGLDPASRVRPQILTVLFVDRVNRGIAAAHKNDSAFGDHYSGVSNRAQFSGQLRALQRGFFPQFLIVSEGHLPKHFAGVQIDGVEKRIR